MCQRLNSPLESSGKLIWTVAFNIKIFSEKVWTLVFMAPLLSCDRIGSCWTTTDQSGEKLRSTCQQTSLVKRCGLLVTRPVWWEGDVYLSLDAIPSNSRRRSGSGETQARPEATAQMIEKHALVHYLNEKWWKVAGPNDNLFNLWIDLNSWPELCNVDNQRGGWMDGHICLISLDWVMEEREGRVSYGALGPTPPPTLHSRPRNWILQGDQYI